jgi:hypothetical protein
MNAYLVADTGLTVIFKELTIKGFNIFKHYEEWPYAFVELNKLIQEVTYFEMKQL